MLPSIRKSVIPRSIFKPPPSTPWEKFRADPKPYLASKFHSDNDQAVKASSPRTGSLTIVCISDTHTLEPDLPDGDLLLHAGDLTNAGSFDEMQGQLDWLNRQSHKHKVVIAGKADLVNVLISTVQTGFELSGNHDSILSPSFIKNRAPSKRRTTKDTRTHKDLKWGSITYLENSSTNLHFPDGRTITIYGSPLTPEYGRWPFQYPPTADVWKNAVPGDTDILLTHGPPKGHLDTYDGRTKGCPHLLRELWRLRKDKGKLKLVVFGHIHDGYGQEVLSFDARQRYFDGVMTGEKGWVAVVILMLIWCLGKIGMIERRKEEGVRLVNTAHLVNDGSKKGREPVVVRW